MWFYCKGVLQEPAIQIVNIDIIKNMLDCWTDNISLKHIENFEADTIKYTIKDVTEKM